MGRSKHKKEKHRQTRESDDEKRHRRRSRSRTRSSDSSSAESSSTDEYQEKDRSRSQKTMEKIEEERRLIKEEKRRQKQLRKLHETPQEKRLRRQAKKLEKERRQKSQAGWNSEHMGMTNEDNPFGDSHLTETFVWKRKLEKQGLSNVPIEHLKKLTTQKIEENKRELEKLEEQRLERARQREAIEKEKETLQRIKEAEYHRVWEKQEDAFHYDQVRLRSKIRIRNGRAKPIDLLGHYINEDDDDSAVEMHEPSTYLNGLTIRDLEDLIADIKVYTELEQQQKPENRLHKYDAQYWQDVTTITQDELAKLRKLSAQLYNDQRVDDRREGINSAVYTDVTETFKNKTPQQLELLEQKIKKKIETQTNIDIAYWESLLSQLQAHMARVRLHERHQLTLKRKLRKMKEDFGIFHGPTQTSSSSIKSERKTETSDIHSESIQVKQNHYENDEDLEERSRKDYERACYSPILLNINDLDLEIQKRCTNEIEDLEKLRQQRESVIKSGSVKPDVEDAFENYVRSSGGFTADDAMINTEVPMDIQYLWSDKYRPRKPRFFNKVHTGYDWNQYNKKHYDTDNPPPKTVQGYKFNIFYPDLIDKTKTPSYTLAVCEDNRDFSILKFRAGPPYEDIAFKIVNKEWDYSYKHGFRCQFQNGIFQLWFHFRKWKYRR